MKDSTLEEWEYSVDGKTLRGKVYDMDNVPDGTNIITAEIVKMGLMKKKVTTKTATFKLGKRKTNAKNK